MATGLEEEADTGDTRSLLSLLRYGLKETLSCSEETEEREETSIFLDFSSDFSLSAELPELPELLERSFAGPESTPI